MLKMANRARAQQSGARARNRKKGWWGIEKTDYEHEHGKLRAYFVCNFLKLSTVNSQCWIFDIKDI